MEIANPNKSALADAEEILDQVRFRCPDNATSAVSQALGRTLVALKEITARQQELERLLEPKSMAAPDRCCTEIDETVADSRIQRNLEEAMDRFRDVFPGKTLDPTSAPSHPTQWRLSLPVDNRVLQDAIKRWGNGRQMTKAIEEMAELTTAILHHDDKKASLGEVLGEAADAMIMLLQLRMIYGAEGFDRSLRLKMEALEKKVKA